jgi:hypothetical protein
MCALLKPKFNGKEMWLAVLLCWWHYTVLSDTVIFGILRIFLLLLSLASLLLLAFPVVEGPTASDFVLVLQSPCCCCSPVLLLQSRAVAAVPCCCCSPVLLLQSRAVAAVPCCRCGPVLLLQSRAFAAVPCCCCSPLLLLASSSL